jgi:hypothetical protein
MQWFAHDMAVQASSCAAQPLQLSAASSRSADADHVVLCSSVHDCTPTLLLMLHTWGSDMQQLWFESDLTPLLSFPSDVNIVFATSLNGADLVTSSILQRVAALQGAGSLFDWFFSFFGMAAAPPATGVILQQLSSQHRASDPFLYVLVPLFSPCLLQ